MRGRIVFRVGVVVALNLSKVHPKLRTIARNLPAVAASQGFNVRVTSGYRTYAQQAKLYRDYMNGLSQYPANPPGQSQHEKGLALDILSDNTLKLVDLLRSVGLNWAGYVDPIHFQIGTAGLMGSPQSDYLSLANPKPKTESFWTSFKKSADSILDILF